MMDYNIERLQQKASGEKRENKELFKKLRKMHPSDLDERIHSLHNKYMEEIDCLECGNCCKSISPAAKDSDISRLSKFLKTKPSELAESYFEIDDEGDYVFKTQPCPFIGGDNYCSVYNARPRACKEYPHTDQVKIQKILDITFQNIFVCPIVYEIVQELKRDYS